MPLKGQNFARTRRRKQSADSGRRQLEGWAFAGANWSGLETSQALAPDFVSQLAAIVEFSNDAIFSRTVDGKITTWNNAAERMFGYSAKEIIGRSSWILLPPGRSEEGRALIERLRSGETVQHFETERLRKDGSRLQVSLALSPIRDLNGKVVSISTIARDITEQRRMQEALARSERELADLFEEASIGLMWVSPKGIVLRANRALLGLVQCAPHECFNHSIRCFQPDDSNLDDLLKRLARGEVLRGVSIELKTTSGELRPVLIDANAFWEHDRLIHTRWFVRDISQRKRLEREILELSERERRSFAQELHDGLGQQLGGIAYLTNVLHAQLLERRAPEAAETERIFVLVRNAIEQSRRLARGLSPIRAEPEGLMDALRDLVVQTREIFGVDCRFRARNQPLISDSVLAGHLYRIAQEALNNAVKHAEAQRIDISLRRGIKYINLTIRDDGCGIGTMPARRTGLGLRIMQYRADLVRARLMIRPSRENQGTEIRCTVPCAPDNLQEQ